GAALPRPNAACIHSATTTARRASRQRAAAHDKPASGVASAPRADQRAANGHGGRHATRFLGSHNSSAHPSLWIRGRVRDKPDLPGKVTQAIRSPEAMKATLASQVVGRPLVEAQQFMEQEGFTCSLIRQGSFKYGADGEHDVRRDIDFLY